MLKYYLRRINLLVLILMNILFNCLLKLTYQLFYYNLLIQEPLLKKT